MIYSSVLVTWKYCQKCLLLSQFTLFLIFPLRPDLPHPSVLLSPAGCRAALPLQHPQSLLSAGYGGTGHRPAKESGLKLQAEPFWRVWRSSLPASLQVGYCQGISFVAGVLLLHMSEEQAFDMLKFLMYDLGIRLQYKPDMVSLQVSEARGRERQGNFKRAKLYILLYIFISSLEPPSSINSP